MTTIASPYPSIAIPDVALTPFVLQNAAQYGDRTALVCGVTGGQYTYRELPGVIERAAGGFHAHGVRKKDVVGIVSPNVPDFAVAFHGLATLGAISSTVNPVATAEEIAKQFQDSSATMILTVPQLLEKCVEAARSLPRVREIVVFGEATGATPFASLLDSGVTAPAVAIDPAVDLVALPYSSGTSGIPKGVMLTHRNLVANLLQMSSAGANFGEEDRVVGVLPFFHIYGLVVIMNGALRNGATIVTLPRFELENFLGVLQTHRITYANVVPPIVLALAKHPLVDKFDLSALKQVFSGAAPLGDELAGRCASRLNLTVRQGYGLTETSPVTHVHPHSDDIVEYGSVGPPVASTECRVVNPDTGEDMAVGERGELWIRGPQVMVGYLNKPEATAACMTADGWFKTGDVAVADAKGWFMIVDRVKELIKYKGMQVAPAELEAVLLSHAGIADAAVIPIPDEDAGEIPKAFVVLRTPLSEADIMSYVAERVSSYKKVRRVEIVDAIPKSPSGKILRRLLVEKERLASTMQH